MIERRRGPGRPTNAMRNGGQKESIGLRVAAELKNRLHEEGRRSGRNLSEEVERRVQATLTRQDGLGETLALMLGDRGATLARGLIDVIRLASLDAGVKQLGVTRMVENPQAVWADPWCHEQLRIAVDKVVDHFKPSGKAVPPIPSIGEIVTTDPEAEARERREWSWLHPGEIAANHVIRQLRAGAMQ